MNNYTILACLLLGCLTLKTVDGQKKVFCYYGSEAQYRQARAKFMPKDINPFLCTHIIFAFVNVEQNVFKPLNWNDLDSRYHIGLYRLTRELKKKNPDLKILLAVGGWVADYKPFERAMISNDTMKEFANNCVKYLRRYRLDGLDMDWEYPGTRSSPTEDREKFTIFMQIIHDAFKKDGEVRQEDKLILTLATAVGEYYMNAAYETREIHKYADYVLLMTYNFHGGWDRKTGHHCAVLPDSSEEGPDRKLCQAFAVNFWLSQGVPKEKMILGLATFGMSFTLMDPFWNDVGDPAIGGGHPGPYVNQRGVLAYYEICDKLNKNHWESVWLREQRVPIARSGDQWVGYDTPRSMEIKVNSLVHGSGLAGTFIWSLDLDDFSGRACNQGKYPLLTAINNALNNPPPSPGVVSPSPFCNENREGTYPDELAFHRYFTCSFNGTSVQTFHQCEPGYFYSSFEESCVGEFAFTSSDSEA